MAKKEFKIGEEFQFGLVKLRVEKEDENSCLKCFFNKTLLCGRIDDITGDIIVTDGTRPILSNSTNIGKKEDLARDYSKRVSNGRVVIQDYTACAYMAGWDACMEYLAGLPLDESMNEIMNNCEGKED